MINEISIIKKTILESKKPFSVRELLKMLKKDNVENRELIFSVLDQLLNDGLVGYDDFIDDVPYYKPLFMTVTA